MTTRRLRNAKTFRRRIMKDTSRRTRPLDCSTPTHHEAAWPLDRRLCKIADASCSDVSLSQANLVSLRFSLSISSTPALRLRPRSTSSRYDCKQAYNKHHPDDISPRPMPAPTDTRQNRPLCPPPAPSSWT